VQEGGLVLFLFGRFDIFLNGGIPEVGLVFFIRLVNSGLV
jgi:hypothetical protein